MFFRFRNILSRNMLSKQHQINKRFFSNNCNNCNNICKFNLEEFNNVKNMITYIQILSTINYFITFIILLIK
jgi:hypothetical protein